MNPKHLQITSDDLPLIDQRVITHTYGWPRRPFVAEYLGPDREDLLLAAHAAANGQELTLEMLQHLGRDYEAVVAALEASDERTRVAEQQLRVHQGIAEGLLRRLELIGQIAGDDADTIVADPEGAL